MRRQNRKEGILDDPVAQGLLARARDPERAWLEERFRIWHTECERLLIGEIALTFILSLKDLEAISLVRHLPPDLLCKRLAREQGRDPEQYKQELLDEIVKIFTALAQSKPS